MTPDFINATFEMLGAGFLALNIAKILKDKNIQGVSLLAMAFFTSWSLWNIWYYADLSQTLSAYASVAIGATNAVYLWLAFYYTYIKKKDYANG